MANKIKLLITGFGPFSNYQRNPSGDFALSMNGMRCGAVSISGIKIPTSWSYAWPVLCKVVWGLRPHGLLLLGQAPEQQFLFESVARNVIADFPDANGLFPAHDGTHKIVSGGSEYYAGSLPNSILKDQFCSLHRSNPQKHPFIGAVSENAGQYLCNFIYYLSLRIFKGIAPYKGFVHHPPYPEAESSYSEVSLFDSLRSLVILTAEWLENTVLWKTKAV